MAVKGAPKTPKTNFWKQLTPQTAVWIAFGLLCGLAATGLILLLAGPRRGEPITLLPAPTPQNLSVYVTGAVADPGLYELPPGARGQDALDAAGGPLVDANLEAFNLARPLQDGEQLRVPHIGEPTPGQAGFPININTADVEQLSQLPGIGPVIAQAIIDYRDFHGPFTDPAEIQNVSGIGPSTYDSIEELITIE